MQIKRDIHTNVLDTYKLWNAWKPSFTFPIESVNEEFLSNIIIEESIYESTIRGEEFLSFDLLTNEIYSKIQLYKTKWLITFGHEISKKNKLRSYKGLSKHLKIPDLVVSKFELEFEDQLSVLIEIIDLDSINSFNFERVFYESPNSYIILSNDLSQLTSFDKVNLMKDTLVIYDQSVYLNFYNTLIFWFSKTKFEEIIRLGGNGDSEISIQGFKLKGHDSN